MMRVCQPAERVTLVEPVQSCGKGTGQSRRPRLEVSVEDARMSFRSES